MTKLENMGQLLAQMIMDQKMILDSLSFEPEPPMLIEIKAKEYLDLYEQIQRNQNN